MRKLILISFLPLLIFAQSENQSQSIELPDFVITGKQHVNLPVMKKAKADPVSILSKEYFFPSFTPEQFSLATVAKPSPQLPELLSEKKAYNKQLILGAGQYTLPTGEFYFAEPFSVGKFYSKLWGTNQKDYVDYANYNVSGINLGTEFYVDREAGFLPGAIFSIDGEFVRKQYNFYSNYQPSKIAPVERETQNFSGSLSLENYYGDIFKYKFSLSGNHLAVKDNDTKEVNLKFSGDTKTQLGLFSILLKGKYQQQGISLNSGDNSYSFYNLISGIQLNFGNEVVLRGGLGYFNAETKIIINSIDKERTDLIAPWGELEYIFNNSLSFIASYKPEIEFKTYTDYLEINPYTHINRSTYTISSMDNGTKVLNHKLNLALTYGYKKYYEITVGGEFFIADKYDFLNPLSNSLSLTGYSNFFRIERISNVTGYSIYANALYHLGPFGWFYGDAKYEIVKSDDNFLNKEVTIPYHPKLSLEAAYGYQFSFGFSAELKLHYLKDTYGDLANNKLLGDYINLSANLRYSLTQNFDFTLYLNNLLNRDNYLWLGYIEPPFDFVAGIDFRF